jgi:DNA-binding IclR family transcriptional regulator
MQNNRGRNNSSSLRRAIGVLDALVTPTAAGKAVPLAQLAVLTGLSKPTLLRLLDALSDCGLVCRTADGYALGLRTLTYGEAYLAGTDLPRVARPALTELAAQTGETAHLVVFDEPEVIYIDKVDSSSAVRMHSRIGHHAPAYCTSVGKALLAWLPDDVVTRVLAQPLQRRTPNTLTDPKLLRNDLELTRQRGWALDNVENELEIRCVGAPIIGRGGAAIAACSVSGPDLRLTLTRASQLGPLVARAAAHISRLLGAPEQPKP